MVIKLGSYSSCGEGCELLCLCRALQSSRAAIQLAFQPSLPCILLITGVFSQSAAASGWKTNTIAAIKDCSLTAML